MESIKETRELIVKRFHQLKISDDKRKAQEAEKVRKQRESNRNTTTIRRGNRVYRKDISTGNEVLIGYYVKTASGEVFKEVSESMGLVDFLESEVAGDIENYKNDGKLEKK